LLCGNATLLFKHTGRLGYIMGGMVAYLYYTGWVLRLALLLQ